MFVFPNKNNQHMLIRSNLRQYVSLSKLLNRFRLNLVLEVSTKHCVLNLILVHIDQM
jgi:hypothetical protein